MPCPFVNRLGGNFLKNYGSLLKMFAEQCPALSNACPILSRGVTTNKSSLQHGVPHPVPASVPAVVAGAGSSSAGKCPFMRDMKSVVTVETSGVEDGEETPDGFDYEGFFEAQILKKKLDHSYRVFKKVNRSGASFPTAKEYTWGEKEINVWCSNDYLGMSAHPKVTGAVK